MRFTASLNRQHIGFMFKQHWKVQGKRKVQETNAAASLLPKGIKINDPNEYLEKFVKKEYQKVEIDDVFEKPLKLDELHPKYMERPLYLYGDSNVVVEGVTQTQVLLKTLVFDELPAKMEDKFKSLKLPTDIERSMQQSVLVSHLLDAEQQKTAKIVNALRPMRPFPRNYGITEARKNLLLSTRLLNHCERFHGHTVSADRKIINNAFFVAPFEKEVDQIQLELTAETFMSTRKPINPFKVQVQPEQNVIPNIFPLKETVSIPQVNFYKKQNAYPIKPTNQFSHPHTIMLHFSSLDVKNLFETPVTASQFESRAMLKAFAVAASRARSLYGSDVTELEKPIVVQVVQLESKRIQFGVFQLNTLDLNGSEGVKNYWFRKPEMDLYEDCYYNEGRPALTSYNFDVFRLMNVFYSS